MGGSTAHLAHSGYLYFSKYWLGMGERPVAYRWAWHAYTDGERTQTELNGKPKQWWHYFKHFRERVTNKAMAHGKYTPEIWLSEQGVVFFVHEKLTGGRAWLNRAHGEAIMRAYVARRKQQLTNQSSQITRFFSYSSRGDLNFDSGLLEAVAIPKIELNGKLLTKHRATSAPRPIFNIYKRKTPG